MDLKVNHIKWGIIVNFMLMINQTELKKYLGKVDIYVLDQLMKNRYTESDKILDAGCGKGRNFEFMSRLGFNISACDQDIDCIQTLKSTYPQHDFKTANLNNLPYDNDSFDHIICNAVLHFSTNKSDFLNQLKELKRVLKTKGTLFIRMTSIFGLEQHVIPKNEQYLLPDGTTRFLLTTDVLNELKTHFKFIEPLKTVNVDNLRCMSTLVLEKK